MYILQKKHYDKNFRKGNLRAYLIRQKVVKFYFLFLLSFLFSKALHSQNNAGITIKVLDTNKRAISGVQVEVYQVNGEEKTQCVACTDTTDISGNYARRNLTVGNYSFKFKKEGYNFIDKEEVELNSTTAVYLEIVESKTVSEGTVIIQIDKPKIFDKKLPIILINSPSDPIKKLSAGVTILGNGQMSVMGSRPTGNLVKINNMASPGVSPGVLGISSQAFTSTGLRAQHGDFTGGLTEITLKSPSMRLTGIAQLTSSEKLDAFGTNGMELFLSGPLWLKKEKRDNKTYEYIKLGFVFDATLNYLKDNAPSANGVYYVKPEVQNNLEENPLLVLPNNFVHRASYLTENDVTHSKAKLNSPLYQVNSWGQLVYNVNPNLSISAYGSYFYNYGFSASNSIMNYANNARFDNRIFTSYLLLNHNLPTAKNSTIKNAFYQVRLEYQNSESKSRDANHLDNLFDYGYLGKFTNYSAQNMVYKGDEQGGIRAQRTKFINQFGDTVWVSNYYTNNGVSDTLIQFEMADLNATRARYTQSLFDYYKERDAKMRNVDQLISSSGLRNGDNLSGIYNLWAVPGAGNSFNSKRNTQNYGLWSMGQFVYKPKAINGIERNEHAIQFGINYDQQINRFYSVNAMGLWGLMRQLVNRQIQTDNNAEGGIQHATLSYDQYGNFRYTVLIKDILNPEEQTVFDKNFRAKLIANGVKDIYGKKIDEFSYLNTDQYSPSDFALNMFSADELLNNGNSLVDYYGYDYLGNKIKGKPSPESFINDKQRRSIGAFQPVYFAAWLEDQFQFKDLVFSAGLRFERYDANQYVLRDPYSLYPIKTAEEINGKNFAGKTYFKPANIGDDFLVYANDIENPDKIVGFRDGDKWYNENGVELNSPESIANATKSGRIAPYLVDPKNQNLTKSGLKDFTPLVSLLPRILFTFPLVRDRKIFYINYDVMAQRPSMDQSFLSIDNLFFLKQKQGNVISNADLKQRIKTNYEVGYKQSFGRKMTNGLDVSVSYSEIRKDFGLYQITQGYPVTYLTYRNIDFATVTALKSSFIFDKKGPFSFYFSYTYMLADGTGSNVNSQATLIASGQPNLRNIVPLGELDIRHMLKGSATVAWGGKGYSKNSRKKLYTGPVVFGKEILRNTSMNLIGNAYSGGPYTPASEPVQIGSTDRQQIKGEPFGARMPWTYTFDLNITKEFGVKSNYKSRTVGAVFLNITNLFNTQNITNVYRFTGSASDDGYLNSAKGQQAIQNQVSAESFVSMYKLFLNSNAAYSAPRRIQFGLRFFFNRATTND